MKGVMVSPLVALAVWSVGALIVHGEAMPQSPNAAPNASFEHNSLRNEVQDGQMGLPKGIDSAGVPFIAPLGATSVAESSALSDTTAIRPIIIQPPFPGGQPLWSTPPSIIQQQQAVAAQQQRTYYYDPTHATRTAHGSWILPETVYDTTGRPISLTQLQQPAQKEPPLGSIPKDFDSFKKANATDQSIVVATVGVMALLLGALSAKRLRARSLLGHFVENESLREETAYDSSGAWREDLEKFDV